MINVANLGRTVTAIACTVVVSATFLFGALGPAMQITPTVAGTTATVA